MEYTSSVTKTRPRFLSAGRTWTCGLALSQSRVYQYIKGGHHNQRGISPWIDLKFYLKLPRALSKKYGPIGPDTPVGTKNFSLCWSRSQWNHRQWRLFTNLDQLFAIWINYRFTGNGTTNLVPMHSKHYTGNGIDAMVPITTGGFIVTHYASYKGQIDSSNILNRAKIKVIWFLGSQQTHISFLTKDVGHHDLDPHESHEIEIFHEIYHKKSYHKKYYKVRQKSLSYHSDCLFICSQMLSHHMSSVSHFDSCPFHLWRGPAKQVGLLGTLP